jgi:hypothetical protein
MSLLDLMLSTFKNAEKIFISSNFSMQIYRIQTTCMGLRVSLFFFHLIKMLTWHGNVKEKTNPLLEFALVLHFTFKKVSPVSQEKRSTQ